MCRQGFGVSTSDVSVWDPRQRHNAAEHFSCWLRGWWLLEQGSDSVYEAQRCKPLLQRATCTLAGDAGTCRSRRSRCVNSRLHGCCKCCSSCELLCVATLLDMLLLFHLTTLLGSEATAGCILLYRQAVIALMRAVACKVTSLCRTPALSSDSRRASSSTRWALTLARHQPVEPRAATAMACRRKHAPGSNQGQAAQ